MRILDIHRPDPQRILLMVLMPDPNRYLTDACPHLPETLFRLFPRMEEHRCDNDHGYSFREECACTEVPHLLEHLILELLTQAGAPLARGTTSWDWRVDPRGTYRVHVEHTNERLVVAAVHLAERIIRAIDDRRLDDLDLPAEIAALRSVAREGRRRTRLRRIPAVPSADLAPA